MTQSEFYNEEFYKFRNESTRYAADTILGIVINTLPHINSAADVGCGVGTWLAVVRKRGVENVRGFDGPWVNKDLLEIPYGSFEMCNLEKPINSEHRFDLAISLEVAEHLPELAATNFIESLTKLADFVLFSAAIPYQGGVNHLNEQWQSYWAEKFALHGYLATDPVRPRIWEDKNISIPYRQNIILYVKKSRILDVKASVCECNSLSRAHPDLYMLRNTKSVMQSLRDLCKCLARKYRILKEQSRPS